MNYPSEYFIRSLEISRQRIFWRKKKRRKIRSININLEIKMFGNKIIEGFLFLRLNTNEKIRSINYPPEYFIRSRRISR